MKKNAQTGATLYCLPKEGTAGRCLGAQHTIKLDLTTEQCASRTNTNAMGFYTAKTKKMRKTALVKITNSVAVTFSASALGPTKCQMVITVKMVI